MLLVLLSAALLSTFAAPPACGAPERGGKTADEICQDYCTGKCAFNIDSDSGTMTTTTLYRVTPADALTPGNKNYGDPLGDIGFYLSLRTGHGGRFLKGNNVIAAFDVTVDGLWNVYKMCNPLNSTADGSKPYDNFVCGYNCYMPETECPRFSKNASSYRGFGSSQGFGTLNGTACTCPSTGRDRRAAGREASPPLLRRPTTLRVPRPQPPVGWLTCSDAVASSRCKSSGSSSWYHRTTNATKCAICAADDADLVEACGGADGDVTPARLHSACARETSTRTCAQLLASLTANCKAPTSTASGTACFWMGVGFV